MTLPPATTFLHWIGAVLAAVLAIFFTLIEVHRAAGYFGTRRGHPWTIYLGSFETLTSVVTYFATTRTADAVGVKPSAAMLVAAIASPLAGAATSRIPLRRAEAGRLRSLRDHALDAIQCRAARCTSDWLEQDILPALRQTPGEEIQRRGVTFLSSRVGQGRAPEKVVDLYRKSLKDNRVESDERLLTAMELLLNNGGRDVVDGFRKRMS